MFESSVVFAFRDRITYVIADFASKALRNEVDYCSCCALPKLTEFLRIAPVQMNSELRTLVTRGYVTIQNEICFPTWKALKTHPDFKGISVEDSQAIISRLRLQRADPERSEPSTQPSPNDAETNKAI